MCVINSIKLNNCCAVSTFGSEMCVCVCVCVNARERVLRVRVFSKSVPLNDFFVINTIFDADITIHKTAFSNKKIK